MLVVLGTQLTSQVQTHNYTKFEGYDTITKKFFETITVKMKVEINMPKSTIFMTETTYGGENHMQIISYVMLKGNATAFTCTSVRTGNLCEITFFPQELFVKELTPKGSIMYKLKK